MMPLPWEVTTTMLMQFLLTHGPQLDTSPDSEVMQVAVAKLPLARARILQVVQLWSMTPQELVLVAHCFHPNSASGTLVILDAGMYASNLSQLEDQIAVPHADAHVKIAPHLSLKIHRNPHVIPDAGMCASSLSQLEDQIVVLRVDAHVKIAPRLSLKAR